MTDTDKGPTLHKPNVIVFGLVFLSMVLVFVCGAYLLNREIIHLPWVKVSPVPTEVVQQQSEYVYRVDATGDGKAIFERPNGTTVEFTNIPNESMGDFYVVANPSYSDVAYITDTEAASVTGANVYTATLTIRHGDVKREISSNILLGNIGGSHSSDITHVNVVSWTQSGILLEYQSQGSLVGLAYFDPLAGEISTFIDLTTHSELPIALPKDYAIHGTGKYIALSTIPGEVDKAAKKDMVNRKTKMQMYLCDISQKRVLKLSDWDYKGKEVNMTLPYWPTNTKLIYSIYDDQQVVSVDFENWTATVPIVDTTTTDKLHSILAGHFFYGDVVVGSGYSEGIKFIGQNSYVYLASEYDTKKKFLAEAGTYTVVSPDTVVLTPQYRLDLKDRKIAAPSNVKTIKLKNFAYKYVYNDDVVTMQVEGEGFIKNSMYWDRGDEPLYAYSSATMYQLTDLFLEPPLNRLQMTIPKEWARERMSADLQYNNLLGQSEIGGTYPVTLYILPKGRFIDLPVCSETLTSVTEVLGGQKERLAYYCQNKLVYATYKIPGLEETFNDPRIVLVVTVDLLKDGETTKNLLAEVDLMVASISLSN